MKPGCPNLSSSFHQNSSHVVRDGSYWRKDDSRQILRFRCQACGKRFSAATETLEWRQKKRRVNHPLFNLLSSGVSLRRSSIILNIHPVTVSRKLVYLAKKAQISQKELLTKLQKSKVKHMQFDDLITSEHTKMKPLSVTLAVDAKRRFILGVEVSQIGAFGLLAEKSRKKYGHRKNTHKQKMHELFRQIEPSINPHALIESDEHRLYSEAVKKHFPQSDHKQYKGGRGCIAGQGELKKLNYDPLFILNHSCAMLRANIDRLIRKTWCTTKSPQKLKHHLDVYIQFHNHIILKDQFSLLS